MNVTSLNKKMSNQSAVYNRNIAQTHFSSETFLKSNFSWENVYDETVDAAAQN